MAAQEKLRCKVTDTKTAIIKAYKSHLDEINQRSSVALDPTKIQAQKKQSETLKRVENVANLDINEQLQSLNRNISNSLTGVLNSLEQKRAALADVEEAIKIKKDELKEIYDIETEAGTLAALIEAKTSEQEALEKEFDERKAELEEEINEAEKAFEKQKKGWKEQIDELKRQDITLRQREAEEHTYTFARQKQQMEDKLKDEISAKEKVMAEREEAIAEREAQIDSLEAKVGELENRLKVEIEEAVEKTKEREKRNWDTQKKFIDIAHKGEIEKLTTQVESANSRISDLTALVDKLQTKLDTATSQVQEIARDALKSGADVKTLAELRAMDSNSNRK